MYSTCLARFYFKNGYGFRISSLKSFLDMNRIKPPSDTILMVCSRYFFVCRISSKPIIFGPSATDIVKPPLLFYGEKLVPLTSMDIYFSGFRPAFISEPGLTPKKQHNLDSGIRLKNTPQILDLLLYRVFCAYDMPHLSDRSTYFRVFRR